MNPVDIAGERIDQELAKKLDAKRLEREAERQRAKGCNECDECGAGIEACRRGWSRLCAPCALVAEQLENQRSGHQCRR